jgi:addiction module HigA family antidote
MAVTMTEFARQLSVPQNRITEIIKGRRGITGDTALRLGHWFGNEPQFWMNLQAQFDLAAAEEDTGTVIATWPTREVALG